MSDFHGFLTVVWPGQFALTKAFATWGSELLRSRKRFRQGCYAWSARPDESICDMEGGSELLPSRNAFVSAARPFQFALRAPDSKR